MSDANRTAIGIVEESTFGVTPASPAIRAVRITRAGLGASPQTVTSSELAADRQVRDLIRTGFETGGDIGMEASYAAMDELLRGALFSEWNASGAPVRFNNGVADSQITNVDGAGVYTILTAGTNPDVNQGAYAAGSYVRASGFTNANNNGLKRATAATATSVTLAGASTVEAAPPGTARLKSLGFQGAAGDISATAAPNTLVTAALSFTNLGIVAGMWLKVGGPVSGEQFATAANNGLIRVQTVTATMLTLDVVPTGWTTDNGATKTITVYSGDYIRNGTTARSYTVEQQFQDLAVPEFHYFTGMRVGTMTLEGDAQAILTGAVAFQGKGSSALTTRVGGATDIAAPTNDVLNTSTDIGRIAENGVPVTGVNAVLRASLELNNNLRRRNEWGSIESPGIGAGRFEVRGTLNTYYGSKSILDKIRAGTASSFDFTLKDPTGTKALLFDVPRVKFAGGDPTVPGIDTDRVLDTEFQGLRHPVLGYTLQAQRFEELFI